MEAAVVSAGHGAMGSLLGKLGDLLTDKYKLLKGAKGQIMFLKAELEHMHVFLKKISDTEEPDEQDMCWAKEVRELSYDIEDNINEFMHRVEWESSSKPKGFKGFINRSMNLLTTMNTRHEVAKEFEGLKRRVVEVSERRIRYKIEDAVSKQNTRTIDTRLLALYAETASLVGIDRPRDELIQLLDEKGVPAPQLKVLSIVGFGGLGKTTLANEIYGKIKGQFQCQAFVSVSLKPDIRKILRTILSQVGSSACQHNNWQTWDENELISALRKFLFDKRYLIVIDDIWSDSAWYIIKCALPENNKGSRLITTTRIETVAIACSSGHPEYVYKMKPLSDQDSRKLFFRRIFGSEVDCPLYLKDVSAEILKKCGGMPLAIITISSLLASNPNRQKEQWDYVRKSLGSNLKVSSSLEHMRHILNLSYLNLPHYLKTCLLYLGIYPEDYTIWRSDLTRQWMAEGFISKVQGADPEDVAKSYFNELINMSMVQPVDTDDYNGEVTSCRVHDMMLDLILHKSREDNFITVIDHEVDMITQQGKIRRLSLHMDHATNDRIVRSNQLSQIRTFARFGSTSYLPPFQQLNHLRVLAIITTESSGSEALDFTGICHLFLLKYLKISTYSAVRLPKKIGGLRQLEMFELASNLESPEQELPSDIVHLSRLQHLLVGTCIRLPTGIGNMKSLRTLRSFCLGTTLDNIKGLGELTNLTDLDIYGFVDLPAGSIPADEMVERAREVMRTCFEKLCNLKYLEVTFSPISGCLDVLSQVSASFCHLQRFIAYGHSWFSKVPKWIGQLHYLQDLRLQVEEVLEEDVGLLAQLSSLTKLDLLIHETPKDKIIFRGSGFPALKDFIVVCCRISCLTFEPGAMAKLERIHLWLNANGWDRYGAAPAGLEHLLGIKKITVEIAVGGAKKSNIRAAESVLRNAIDMHPCHPIAEMYCSDFWVFPFTDRLDDEQEDVADSSI